MQTHADPYPVQSSDLKVTKTEYLHEKYTLVPGTSR
jgi:hypothetical protein